MLFDNHLYDFDSKVRKLYQSQGSIKCVTGKGITNILPPANADSTKVLQTRSLNVNGAEVGPSLGKKKNFFLQQTSRARVFMYDYVHLAGDSVQHKCTPICAMKS